MSQISLLTCQYFFRTRAFITRCKALCWSYVSFELVRNLFISNLHWIHVASFNVVLNILRLNWINTYTHTFVRCHVFKQLLLFCFANYMTKQKVKITFSLSLWSLVGFNGFLYHAVICIQKKHVSVILSTTGLEHHLTKLFPRTTDLFLS